MEPINNIWISSIEILQRARISRATLNNYIKMGIIMKPVIRKPDDQTIKAKQIGYFPQDVLDRITAVKSMKKEGYAMSTIVNQLTRKTDISVTKEGIEVRKDPVKKPSNVDSNSGTLRLTINDIDCPAYLLNANFEVEWLNQNAEDNIFRQNIKSIKDVTQRNIFRLLSNMGLLKNDQSRNELVDFHMSLVKTKHEKAILNNLYEGIREREVSILEGIYDRVDSSAELSIHESYLKIISPTGIKVAYSAYRLFFREGVLLIFTPVKDGILQGIIELLSNRASVINDLIRQRLPTLVSFSVMVADLQESTRICAELPPEEYFELINQIWKCMEDSFKNYYGTYGKHTGDGMVYFFLKNDDSSYLLNSICCALELRERIKEISGDWKGRKGWFNEIVLNIGINEGQEYLGNIPASPNIEFTVLGESVNYASRLSDFARHGSIWTTKSLINKLTDSERIKLRYGITKNVGSREVFIENIFSRVMDMFRLDDAIPSKLKDIGTLPVTEIIGKI
ncbi:adenylate/guanylate cyclase domain-containing protein [bacterium]|nr:MAG: adenylate/guanylate cyclase domain-containing protein [bacterium]